jgi:sorbitol/mannitol transport system substrate-binding protein
MPDRVTVRSGRWVGIAAALAASALGLAACSSSSTGSGSAGSGSGSQGSGVQTITVAVVDNPQMTDIQKLTPTGFEADHPNIKVKYVTLDENTLRDQVTKDVAAGGGQFDVVMIGPYEVPTWAKNGWISDLTKDASDPSYNVDDLIKPIRDSLTSDGKLYAVPFYGESSFLMYRKDLLMAAGLTMPLKPTWEQVAAIAQKLNDTAKGLSGICLRGKTGWGENLAPLDTVVNTMGGQWFDTSWNAHLTDPAFTKAVTFYTNLIKTAGETGAANDSFNECANNLEQGKSAMWYDATVGASVVDDPKTSPVAGKLGFAPAPVDQTASSGWLWSWALAEESASKHKDAAWTYMSWATSQKYIEYAGQQLGWARVPPGSRYSTYKNPNYIKAAGDFAQATLDEINSVNVKQPGISPQPYIGVQYVGIPEFEDLGTKVSQEITAVIAGKESVADALAKAQSYATPVGATYK